MQTMTLNGIDGISLSTQTEPAALFGHRLLIVDDTAGIHEDFRKILREEEPSDYDQTQAAFFGSDPVLPKPIKFLIDSAYQGKEALELVERAIQAGQPYALAFVDVRMPPGWDGIETARRLWEIDPRLQIVICTAYSDYSWKDMAGSLGHNDNLVFLKKPFESIEILQLIYSLTEKSKLSRQVRRRLEELDRLVAQQTQELRAANDALIADNAMRKAAELRQAAFAALGKRLNEAESAKAAAEIIIEVADQLLGWDACNCHSYSPTQNRLVHLLSKDIIEGHRTECGYASTLYKLSDLVQKTIAEGSQLVLREEYSILPSDGLPFGDTTRASASILCVPIHDRANIIGILSIQSYTHGAYDQRSLQTLEALADHCGGALNRLKSEEVLRQTEQQLLHSQKMEAIGLLAGGVAHDFNNLLTIILGNAELAIEEVKRSPGEETGYLKEILGAAQRAAKITQQLLMFGRKKIILAKPLDLNQLVTQLSEMLKRLIGLDIELVCNLEEGLPHIHADAGMLDQMVMNLVINSRDSMAGGGLIDMRTQVVEISSSEAHRHPEARSGRFVCLSVKDTGSGIAPKDLSRIFEPFFTTKEFGKGTGLGLSTVFGIVKQHLGWVEVNSTVGMGTTFQIFMPALDPIEIAPIPEDTVSNVDGGSQGVLLVDDESSVRRISRQFLEEAGYRLFEASSGQEALEVWTGHSNEIDLLLTDVSMPGGMNGKVLASRLNVAKPTLKVIFMSGFSGDILNEGGEDVQSANSRFLQKPCTRKELLRAVRDLLDARTVS